MPTGGGEERRHARRPVRAVSQHLTPAARSSAHGQVAGSRNAGVRGSPSADFLQLAQGGPQGWDCLPHTALEHIFNRLELRDLAAAASVCSTWRYEASLDARWRAFWQQQVSDVGLWRWAKADGGYRQQLRAKHLVRRGDCAATVFPFNRRDGAVSEVLFFDGGSRDADKRILTVQPPIVPGQSVRLRGSRIKVWDASALMAQRPLLVVHDVLKHMQLEDGCLFLWRIADDAVVPLATGDSLDAASAEQAAAARWTEHPAITASVLEPGQLMLKDIPLEAPYGRGMTPCEYLDMSGGLVAGSIMVPSQGRLIMRLFDVATGRCLRASSCALVEEVQPPPMLQLQDNECTMIVTRSGEVGSLVAATCALFDSRVFFWRLKDKWVAAGQAAAAAAEAEAASTDAAEREHRLAAARAAAWDPAAVPVANTAVAAAVPGGEGAAGGTAGFEERYELRRVYSTEEEEPIVDLSISTTAQRLFVVGMEHIFIVDLAGVPLMRVSLVRWRGVLPPGQFITPGDVGAFSWPLPNSTKTAFYLDATNSLYIAEFRRPQLSDFWYMQHNSSDAERGRHPHFDHHIAEHLQPNQMSSTYYVQSHTDLRPSTSSPQSTLHGRAAGQRGTEPPVVEYTQDGCVLLTSGDSRCPAVAALLGHEKAAGTYLEGLGSHTAKPRSGGRGRDSSRQQPFVARGGRGQRGKLAPRALVFIDTSSGRRFKAIPLDGVCEAVHSAGQYVVASVAELGSYPDGHTGSIVVLDFAGRGLGTSEEASVAPTPQPETAAVEQQPQQRGKRRQCSASTARRRQQQVEHEEADEEQEHHGWQQKGSRHAKPKSKPGRKQTRATHSDGKGKTPAAVADDEAGPSRKRGKR